MRPAGKVREAVLKAVAELATEVKGATVRELAEKSKVGYKATLTTVRNLKRAEVLHIPRRRKVDYCKCRVAEYDLSKVAEARPASGWEAWRGVGDAFCRRVA